MIFPERKYLYFTLLKSLFSGVLILLLSVTAFAQNMPLIKDTANSKSILFCSHSFAKTKTPHPYLRINYSRPNNQLMSWPDYPLTADQIEERDRRKEQDRKLSNIIAKDIITSLISKKKKVAVIPKF